MLSYVKKRILRFRRRKDPDFPNKCDICGLRAKYVEEDRDIDAAILIANDLQKCGLSKNYPRAIHLTLGGSDDAGHTYFCSLSKLKYWNKPFKRCPDWQLNISNKLTLSDHLAIHHSMNNTKIAFRLGILASLLTVLSVVVGICVSIFL